MLFVLSGIGMFHYSERVHLSDNAYLTPTEIVVCDQRYADVPAGTATDHCIRTSSFRLHLFKFQAILEAVLVRPLFVSVLLGLFTLYAALRKETTRATDTEPPRGQNWPTEGHCCS